MPKIGQAVKPKCKACNGTGRNSRGGVCYPCSVKGKHETIKEK